MNLSIDFSSLPKGRDRVYRWVRRWLSSYEFPENINLKGKPPKWSGEGPPFGLLIPWITDLCWSTCLPYNSCPCISFVPKNRKWHSCVGILFWEVIPHSLFWKMISENKTQETGRVKIGRRKANLRMKYQSGYHWGQWGLNLFRGPLPFIRGWDAGNWPTCVCQPLSSLSVCCCGSHCWL